jgi:hypothetical protein
MGEIESDAILQSGPGGFRSMPALCGQHGAKNITNVSGVSAKRQQGVFRQRKSAPAILILILLLRI